uniref:ATP synthase subunit b, chloroplastic n=1 Tax=Koliella corcontica TaxID=155904 RepID=A0A097KMR1_9CHLO|nr:CF0 subunit I of ATP synthase [Koliella corcontica]AIT94467.1 CF0 subunit I of ATP synthase [Koliella corcontica]
MQILTKFLDIFNNIPIFILEVEGFNFNSNILETNVINLAVVISVVVSFVGGGLKSLLQNRKETIIKNLQEADERAKNALYELNEIKKQLEQAQKKAFELKEEGKLLAEKEKLEILAETEKNYIKLEKFKKQNLELQEKKAINQLSKRIVTMALAKVKEKLKNKLNSELHTSLNNYKIAFFTTYK